MCYLCAQMNLKIFGQRLETLNIYANVVMIGKIRTTLQDRHLPNFVPEGPFQFPAWTMA